MEHKTGNGTAVVISPILLTGLFVELLEWPEGVSKPEFMTREYGKTTGERASRVRDELELELIQTQMAQKPMLRAEVGMRVRCANKASAE